MKIKFAQSKNLLKIFCSQQKLAHRICSQHRWINMMAKCLASFQSEHGWRAPFHGLSRNGWNVLGRTFN
jgi:hypothetical protein